MPIKVTSPCSRCRREEDIEVKDAAEAVALDAQGLRQSESVKRLTEFLDKNGKDLPDFIAILSREPAKLITHNHLCSQGERSCVKTLTALLETIDVRPERKPRTKKVKPAAEDKPEVKVDPKHKK